MGKRDRSLDRVVESIRARTVKTVAVPGGGRVPALDDMVRRVRSLVELSQQSTLPDGFGSTTPGNGNPGGGKGGGRTMNVAPAGEDADLVPTSSTEAAAFAQLAARLGVTDLRLVGRAHRAVELLTLAERVLVQLADELDVVVLDPASVPDPPMCWVAQMKYKLPFDIAWEPYKTTDFGTVLAQPFDMPRPVSSFVYWFVRREHRLPELDEMLAYLQRGVVRVRA